MMHGDRRVWLFFFRVAGNGRRTIVSLVSSEAEQLWVCRACMRVHQAIELNPGAAAQCERCGEQLRVRPRGDYTLGLVWSLTALGLFLAALPLPILRVNKAGLTGEASILVAETGLSEGGMPLLGLVAGLLVFWFPLLVLGLLFFVYLGRMRNWPEPWLRRALHVLQFARRWTMPEVFLLAVLVAFLKIGDLAATSPEPGLWFLVGGTIALLIALTRIERDNLPHELGTHGAMEPVIDSGGPSLALLLAALLLLVPSNLLPIMEVRLPGSAQASTILGGVRSLLEHRLWGIAAIVFVASILVPFAKIIGLGWLLWCARRRTGSRFAMQLYRILENIGRWSMLDVFLVALLAGLIQFDRAAQILPGPAAPTFAAAVVLTALAVEQFDPRRLWLPPRSS